jgi:hypothetical protein
MPNIGNNRRLIMRRRDSSLDTDYLAWKAAVGSVGAAQEAATNALIVSLKAHSLWTVQDRIWLHASENTTQALTCLKSLSVATVTGTVSHVASQGYTGDGSTGFINTGFANGTNYTRNDAGVSVYVRNSRASNNTGTAIGSADLAGTGVQSIISPLSSSVINYDVNNNQFTAQAANTNAQGFWTSVRTGASARALYKNSNSTAFATNTNVSVAITGNVVFYIHARNQNGTANLFGSDQIALTIIGSGMTNGTNVALFQTDFNAYMTALGTNVY